MERSTSALSGLTLAMEIKQATELWRSHKPAFTHSNL
jgi:hypothetical protein